MEFAHILVPVDGSPLSNKAVRYAADRVKGRRTRLTLLHVIPPFTPSAFSDGIITYPDLYSPKAYEESTRAYAKRLLARAAALGKKHGATCETIILYDEQPWSGIIREARRRHCDLIVMASHGRRGVAAVVLGSETSKVLTHSKTPVLVCR